GAPAATAWTFPFFLVTYLGLAPAVALGLGLLVGLRSSRTRAAATAAAVVLATCALLFAGALGEFLPLWPSLFPVRTAVWLAVSCGAAASAFAGAGAPRPPRARAALLVVAAGWAAAFAIEGARLRGLEFGVGFYEESKAGRPSTLAIAGHELLGGAYWV